MIKHSASFLFFILAWVDLFLYVNVWSETDRPRQRGRRRKHGAMCQYRPGSGAILYVYKGPCMAPDSELLMLHLLFVIHEFWTCYPLTLLIDYNINYMLWYQDTTPMHIYQYLS